jgi:hypothetical protein
MTRPKVLVAYYSRTGHTKRLASAIASELGADLERIHDPTDREGVVGYLRSGLESYAGLLVPLEAPRLDPSNYELVIVGTPVWAMSVSPPVRTYLWRERERLPQVAFVATLGGMGAERAFGQMGTLARRAPVATLAVRERVIARGVPREEIARFIDAALAGVTRQARRRRARASG